MPPNAGPTIPANNYPVQLQYPRTEVETVLRLYEQLTGKRLVYDNNVQGPVNIVVKGPVTREEAIKIIEVNLLLNGFSLVPGDGDIVKVIGANKNPRTAGVPIYMSDDVLPDNEQVVSVLFKLQFAAPDELAATLLSYIAPQAWTAVIPLAKSQSLLITENTSVLRGLQRIIRQVDVAPAEVSSEFIELQRADAEDVIEKLGNIFNPEQSQGQNRTVPSPNRNAIPAVPANAGQPGGDAPAQSPTVEITGGRPNEDSLVVGKILLTADIRTNRIHVVTRPINMPFVRDLIQQFDSEVSFGQPTARPLKYVAAGDILDVIVQAISEKGMDEANVPGATSTGGGTGGIGANRGGGTGGSNLGGGGTSSGGGSTLNTSDELGTEPTETTPLAVTVGNSKIIADRRSNAIIVLGNNDVKEKVFQVIDQIDVRAPQVLIRTVIGELTLSDNSEFGVDYLYRSENSTTATPIASTTTDADGNTVVDTVTDAAAAVGTVGRAFAGISRNTSAPILDAGSITSAAAFGTPLAGLTAYLAPIDELQIIVRALESTNRFRVTSRPTVFTSNNKTASILSGQQVAVPVSSVSAFTSGTTTPSVQSNIQFKDIALKLQVVPLINADGDVALDIVQTVDNISGSSIIDGNSIPTISTRYIRTNVLVPDRGVVYLGGLITKNVSDGTSGIPLLSKIPLLGRLFRTDIKSSSRTELIVLLRPEVTRGSEAMAVLREKEEEVLTIEPDLESTLFPRGKRPVVRGSEILRAPAPAARQ